jgi:hypothetical protein
VRIERDAAMLDLLGSMPLDQCRHLSIAPVLGETLVVHRPLTDRCGEVLDGCDRRKTPCQQEAVPGFAGAQQEPEGARCGILCPFDLWGASGKLRECFGVRPCMQTLLGQESFDVADNGVVIYPVQR